MSKGSLISNKMLGSKWLRGKEGLFKDIEHENFNIKERVNGAAINYAGTNSDLSDDDLTIIKTDQI